MCFLGLFVSVVFMTVLPAGGRWLMGCGARVRFRRKRARRPAPGPTPQRPAPWHPQQPRPLSNSAPPQARTPGSGAAGERYSASPADVSQTHPCRFAPRMRPDSVLFSMGKAPSRRFPSRSHLGPSNCSHRGPIGNRPSMENSPKQTIVLATRLWHPLSFGSGPPPPRRGKERLAARRRPGIIPGTHDGCAA